MKKYIRPVAVIGIAMLLSLSSCKDKETVSDDKTTESTTPTVAVPGLISYSIVKEYPHDAHAYTEGLEYIDGELYEGTGQYGKSDLRRSSLETNKVLQQQKLDAKYFGEGITVFNGKIYQLTYREKTGFVYDQKTMKLLQTFSFPNEEGWGMTNDGKNLIYSDGTDILTFMDPGTLKETKKVSVKDQYGPVKLINELEFVKGYIYANVYTQDYILKIDPNTGNVVARADLTTLRQQTGIPQTVEGNESAPEVMNGIAYDAKGNRFFITGKNWPKLFEVKLDN